MTSYAKRLIIGNWKMNPATLADAKKLFKDFTKQRYVSTNTTIVLAAPHVYLSELKKSHSGSKIFFGAQNIFWEEGGAYTGQVSASMVKSTGARFVIVGHSEARALGENDVAVARKAVMALEHDLHTIVCIGESEQDEQGTHLKFIADQMRQSLAGVTKVMTKKLIIAYEPIWAIGAGNSAMQPEAIHRMTLFIRKQLIELFGRSVAESISIIYGGSVDNESAESIVYEGECDGLLVGRASLNPVVFAQIIDVVSKRGAKKGSAIRQKKDVTESDVQSDIVSPEERGITAKASTTRRLKFKK